MSLKTSLGWFWDALCGVNGLVIQISLIAAVASGTTPLLVYLFRRQKRSAKAKSLLLNPDQDPVDSVESILEYISQSAYSIESDVVTLKAKVASLNLAAQRVDVGMVEQETSAENEFDDDPIRRKSEVKKK